jgi:hypothetical protein
MGKYWRLVDYAWSDHAVLKFRVTGRVLCNHMSARRDWALAKAGDTVLLQTGRGMTCAKRDRAMGGFNNSSSTVSS